ncbi:MAG TPA: hypothetical protein VF857_07725, partial [Spirochaetota bacterium]
MAKKTTIWTLNLAAMLIEPDKNEVLKLCEQNGINATFGDRTRFNAAPLADENPINLMPFAEYFVPIVPKCIGSLFDSSKNETLTAIQSYYTRTVGQHPYRYFWDRDPDQGKMYTRPGLGYYEILRETAPNILIGYSQGGLVSRYLLWLAENVFQEKDLISGIVTVSSPNFGSPLANPDNIPAITFGFAKLICLIFLPDIATDRIARKIQSEITFDEVCEFVKTLHTRLISSEIRTLLQEKYFPAYDAFTANLLEVYNWLGGLRDDPDNAFHDLSITELDHRSSVLSSINSDIPLAKIRGIISANNSFPEFVFDIIEEVVGKAILHELDHHFSNKKIIREIVLTPATAILNGYGKFIIRDAQKKKTKIEGLINNTIMTEHLLRTPTNPVILKKLSDYDNGVATLPLAPHAHDFIIPSSYQMTHCPEENFPAKNSIVNGAANHLSGGFPMYDAGK